MILFKAVSDDFVAQGFLPAYRGMGGSVVYYRLYLLSNPDGRFVGFEEIEAPDDVEAVRLAADHVGAQPLELWCGKRKVKSFPAKAVQAE